MTIANSAHEPRVSVDQLLSEREWLRRLALRLTGQDDVADDLAQAVELVIASEPDVGGFVELVEIDPESTIDEDGFRECVRETVYALELAPAGYGGRVGPRYVYAFRPPDGSGRGTLRIVSGETGPAPPLE